MLIVIGVSIAALIYFYRRYHNNNSDDKSQSYNIKEAEKSELLPEDKYGDGNIINTPGAISINEQTRLSNNLGPISQLQTVLNNQRGFNSLADFNDQESRVEELKRLNIQNSYLY